MRFFLVALVLMCIVAFVQAQFGQDVGLVQHNAKRLHQKVMLDTATGATAYVPPTNSNTNTATGTTSSNTETGPAPGAANQPIDKGLSGAITVGASFTLYPFHFNPVTRETDAWTEQTESAKFGATATESTTPTPGAFVESEGGKCPGVCQDSAKFFCKTGYKSGLCTGAATMKCCPTAAAAAASSTNNAGSGTTSGAVSTPASPASLNKCPTPGKCGANSRIQDPVSIARARSFAWTDLTVEQQSNVLRITKEAKLQGITNVNAFAYILATAHWESHLTPINEIGGTKKRYAPYYGRGFVQLTWKANYAKFSTLLKSQRGWSNDLVNRPEQALNPDFAAFVIVYGMKNGVFTGKSLSKYFTATGSDWIGARRMINGQDKATTIASMGRQHVALARALLAMN